MEKEFQELKGGQLCQRLLMGHWDEDLRIDHWIQQHGSHQ